MLNLIFTALGIAPTLLLSQPSGLAATLCVNPGGTAGCSSTIAAAVTAAAPGSTIQVAPGIYKENIVITKTLSLIGAGGNSVIDATGKSTGIFVNGTASAPAPGVSGVVISGFTVKNANFEGILVANAFGVTIHGNTVNGNNLGLVISGDNISCPNLPAFETNEGQDCGEGIHLMGVDHSIISSNRIENNSGGILITDETGPAYANLITANTVANNPYDCGLTIASHGRSPDLPPGLNFGVFRNTVSNNLVAHNGYALPGAGAGVGIYAPGPGSTASANVIINNEIRDNGLGGVTMHNHAAPGVNGVPAQAPPVDFSDNVILGNRITGNGPDSDDPQSPGSTGISISSFAPFTGTIIAQNDFDLQIADIVYNAPSGSIEAHLNNFRDNGFAVFNEGTAGVSASQNFWGCPDGPGGAGCSVMSGPNITAPSWMQAPFGAPQPLPPR
jgi:nitrous oxidase accessory protein NosD